MADDNKVLIELEFQGSQKTLEQLVDVENQLKEVNKNIKTNTGDSIKNKNEQIKLREARKTLNAEVKKQVQNFKDDNVQIEKLGKSYNDLVLKNKILVKEYKQLDPSLKENAERMEQLASEIKNNTDTLKDYDEALGRNFRNVGNYKEAITEALQESGLFGRELGVINKVQKTFTDVTEGAGKAVSFIKDDFNEFRGNILKGNKGIIASIKSLKGLRIALIATGLGAITIILGTVITLFQRWQPAIDFASKAMTILGSVINEVISRAGILATAVVKLFKGDFKGASEDAKKAVDNLSSSLVDAAKNGAKIADTTVELRKLRREINLTNQQLQNQRDIAQLIADDNTRNFELRRQEAEKVRELNERIAQNTVKLAQKEFEIIKRKVANDKLTNELLDEQNQKLVELKQAELDLRLVQEENAKVRREINRDQLEAQLDILIDGFDNQKTINEKSIENDRKTFEERRNILEATRQLGTKSFNEQVAIIQKLTDERVNANELISEQDAVALVKRIEALKLDEISQTRLLEIIRDRKTAISDLTELEIELNEAEVESTRKSEQAKLDIEKEKNKDSKDDLIATIQKERELKLEDTRLTEEERQAIIFESEEKIKEIKKASVDSQKQTEEQAISERINKISQAEQQIGSLLTATSNLFEAQKNRELNAAGDNAKKREEIEKKFAKRGQRLAIADALIRGSLAVMRIAADVPKADFGIATGVMIGAQIALTASQVAAIASQKFAKGGLVDGGMFEGKSHAEGGIKFASGGRIMEAEGGEAIINKRSTAMFKPLLSAINTAGGGKKFALGGITPDAQLMSSAITESGIGAEVAKQMQNIKVINVVSETTTQQNNISNVESEAIF